MTKDIHADLQTACRAYLRQSGNNGQTPRREPAFTAAEERAILHVLHVTLPMVLPGFFELKPAEGSAMIREAAE